MKSSKNSESTLDSVDTSLNFNVSSFVFESRSSNISRSSNSSVSDCSNSLILESVDIAQSSPFPIFQPVCL